MDIDVLSLLGLDEKWGRVSKENVGDFQICNVVNLQHFRSCQTQVQLHEFPHPPHVALTINSSFFRATFKFNILAVDKAHKFSKPVIIVRVERPLFKVLRSQNSDINIDCHILDSPYKNWHHRKKLIRCFWLYLNQFRSDIDNPVRFILICKLNCLH